MGTYDKSSKWLIQHHGDSILRLAGLTGIEEWRPLQAELVQPSQLPDGLLEVKLAGRDSPLLFVVEIATYPEKRVHEQLARDGLLVVLDRKVVPEVLVVVLHPKGEMRVTDSVEMESELGLANLRFGWRVVELWNLDAEELLALSDPGLMPWVTLTKFSGPPEPVLRRCRDIIEESARPEERANLLAVSQVLAKLRFDDREVLNLFGGKQVMIESPLIDELVNEANVKQARKHILRFLKGRLGPLPDDLPPAIEQIEELDELERLLDLAAFAPDLDSFRSGMSE